MKNWHSLLLGLLLGFALSAALFLIASPPRGSSVELLPAPTPSPLMVQVDGAVLKPGVYALPRESRVQDAVQAAGGLSGQANSAAVNLAARLKDGDKLVVPVVGVAVAPAAVPAAAQNPGNGEPEPSGPININTASEEELVTLPNIGPTRAQQIIAYREQRGGFKTIEEIQEVPGIGPATFERLKSLITVE